MNAMIFVWRLAEGQVVAQDFASFAFIVEPSLGPQTTYASAAGVCFVDDRSFGGIQMYQYCSMD